MSTGKPVSVEEFCDELGGQSEVEGFIEAMVDSCDMSELFETGSVTVSTPKGRRVLELVIREE